MNKLKKASWLILIGFFFLIGYFHENVLTFIYRNALQAYISANFNSKLNFEDAYLKGRYFIIKFPSLPDMNDFRAYQATFAWGFNLKTREIDISVELDQPTWKFESGPTLNKEKLKKVFRQKKRGWKYFFDLTVNKGTLEWFLDDNSPHQILFDAKTDSYSGGYLKIYDDESTRSYQYFSIDTGLKPDFLALSWDCQKFECAKLLPILKLFFPSLNKLKITSGTLNGQVKTNFPYTQRPYMEGELLIENAEFFRSDSLKGKFEKTRIKIEKNPTQDQPLTFLTKIEFLEPFSLTSFNKEEPDWEISSLLGNIDLDGDKRTAIQLDCSTLHADHINQFKLLGDINLDAKQGLHLDLNLHCSSRKKDNGYAKLKIYRTDKQKKAEIALNHFTHTEVGFLQKIIASSWPSIEDVEVLQGTFTGLMEMDLSKVGIRKVNVKHFLASDVQFNHHAGLSDGKFDALSGSAKIRLSDLNPSESLDLELQLTNGSLHLKSEMGQKLPLNNIQANFKVQKGSIEHSLITLNWMGLKGTMDLDWGKSKELLSVRLDGHVGDLLDVVPEKIRRGLELAFPHSKLKIFASFKRTNQKFELSGTLSVQRNQKDEFDLIHFGCDFFKTPSSNQKWSPAGWIYAYDLPLEKYVSPFIFRKGVLDMKGKGEFRGSFDLRKFTLYYNFHDLKLENDDLLIEVQDLHSPAPGKMMGFHQLDLQTYSHDGILPIKEAIYKEKNTGLNFKGIKGTFYFKDDTLDIQNLETYCRGVYLAGNIFLDYQDPAPGVFSVSLNVPQGSGKVSQVQSVLSRLKNTSLFTDLPLEGEIGMRDMGMRLKFDFIPKEYRLEADIQASLTDGSLIINETDLALKGLFLDIDYHHAKESLEISEIQGSLLVGKASKVEEYDFGGNFFKLHDLIDRDIDCDFWVKHDKKELLRIKANSKEIESGLKSIVLHPESHLSCIYPDNFSCRLKDWSEFLQLDFQSRFKLSDLTSDLLLFKKTGLYCFSHSLLDKLSTCFPIEGLVKCNIFLNNKTGKLNYELAGNEISFRNNPGKTCHLAAHQADRKWIIDSFEWDDLHAQAEIIYEDNLLKIPFLGLKQEGVLLLGLDGESDLERGLFTANIHLCRLFLEGISQWPSLNALDKNWQPQGLMQGTGTLKVESLPREPWYSYSIFLEAKLPNFSCCKHTFYAKKPLQINISDRMLSIGNIHLDLLENDRTSSHISIPEFSYTFDRDHLKCPKISFQIPADHLPKIGHNSQQHFPGLVDEQIKDLLIKMKKEGELKGELCFEKTPLDRQFSLRLSDGRYTIRQQDLLLKDFELIRDDRFLHFSAVSQREQCPFYFKGKLSWPNLNAGEVILKDLLSDFETEKLPLKIMFSKDANGLIIHSAQGHFCGLNAALHESVRDALNPHIFRLQGKVDIEFNQFAYLLTPFTAEKIKNLQTGSIFSFAGNYGYQYLEGQDFTDSFYFQGELNSRNTFIKGFEVDKLSAFLKYRPRNLEIASFLIEDRAGRVEAENIFINGPVNAFWAFAIPSLSIKNFRPVLLRDRDEKIHNPNPRFKNLLIKRIELKNIAGDLEESKSWTGTGNLHFLNSSRKNITHPLLAIPAEIILRLGLNPQVLNPVTGTILFDLKYDRFYFTRFKDVYSEGRGSKFYLAEKSTPSWMDIDGNLNVQIKMKQYNLLFKLAELFTVSMEGNIKKPVFSLQKQKNVKKAAKFLQPIHLIPNAKNNPAL